MPNNLKPIVKYSNCKYAQDGDTFVMLIDDIRIIECPNPMTVWNVFEAHLENSMRSRIGGWCEQNGRDKFSGCPLTPSGELEEEYKICNL